MKAFAALLLVFAAGPAAEDPRFSIPKARRSLADHVQAIRALTPAHPYGSRALELDELVDARREIDWGAEGTYWEVLLSLATSASLDVEDSWTQFVKLVPVPGKLRGARAQGPYLMGFRWGKRDDGALPQLEPVIVMLPWWDLGGTRYPELSVEHDPDAPKPHAAPENYAVRFGIPPSIARLKIAWDIELYRKTSVETLPCQAGARFQVPGGAGVVEILEVREGADASRTFVQWTSANLHVTDEYVLLEDGTRAEIFEGTGRGNGAGMIHRYGYKVERAKAKTFRFKRIHESVRDHPVLAMERKEWEAPPAADLLSGAITWKKRPAAETVVVVGAVRRDGWGARMGRIPVRPSEEHPGVEGTQDNTGWTRPVLLEIPPGGLLRYRVFALDAGEWTVWMQAGNWIERRSVSVPGAGREEPLVVDTGHAARIRVRGRSDDGAWLHPVDADKTKRTAGLELPFRIDLEPGEEGEWSGAGLKPGLYLLQCGQERRDVTLVEGANEIDLR